MAEGSMAESKGKPEGGGDDERIPLMQSILDNPFLLLFIGVAVPAVLYTIWGIMDIVQIPIAR
jgi:hypothetical protein